MSQALPLVFSWDERRPVPRMRLRLSKRVQWTSPGPAWVGTGSTEQPFDLSHALHTLCVDIAQKSPVFSHLDPSRMIFSVVRSRAATTHGLQARMTPLRFEGGGTTIRERGCDYQMQRFYVDGREILYFVTFVVPRFLDRDFKDKLVTVFHELYHISPQFDGDVRRHSGRNYAHTSSKKKYDAHMADLAAEYLRHHGDGGHHAFLHLSFGQLCHRHGSIVAYHLPRPRMIPV